METNATASIPEYLAQAIRIKKTLTRECRRERTRCLAQRLCISWRMPRGVITISNGAHDARNAGTGLIYGIGIANVDKRIGA